MDLVHFSVNNWDLMDLLLDSHNFTSEMSCMLNWNLNWNLNSILLDVVDWHFNVNRFFDNLYNFLNNFNNSRNLNPMLNFNNFLYVLSDNLDGWDYLFNCDYLFSNLWDNVHSCVDNWEHLRCLFIDNLFDYLFNDHLNWENFFPLNDSFNNFFNINRHFLNDFNDFLNIDINFFWNLANLKFLLDDDFVVSWDSDYFFNFNYLFDIDRHFVNLYLFFLVRLKSFMYLGVGNNLLFRVGFSN